MYCRSWGSEGLGGLEEGLGASDPAMVVMQDVGTKKMRDKLIEPEFSQVWAPNPRNGCMIFEDTVRMVTARAKKVVGFLACMDGGVRFHMAAKICLTSQASRG
jgi:hypothetical protein